MRGPSAHKRQIEQRSTNHAPRAKTWKRISTACCNGLHRPHTKPLGRHERQMGEAGRFAGRRIAGIQAHGAAMSGGATGLQRCCRRAPGPGSTPRGRRRRRPPSCRARAAGELRAAPRARRGAAAAPLRPGPAPLRSPGRPTCAAPSADPRVRTRARRGWGSRSRSSMTPLPAWHAASMAPMAALHAGRCLGRCQLNDGLATVAAHTGSAVAQAKIRLRPMKVHATAF
jgi:hypothetical protein